MSSDVDISIVGGGLLGSALALYIAQHTSYKISLIERAKPLSKPLLANQRVLALGQAAVDFLSEISVFEDLNEAQCHSYTRMCVWDENSTGQLNFSADEIDQLQLGWMVDGSYLSYVLQQKVLQTSNIDACFETTPTALQWQERGGQQSSKLSQLSYVNSDGRLCTQQSRLLVAADGGNSWLRNQAKIYSNRFNYQQCGIVALIETTKDHEDCAWQRFLDKGPIALLPVADGLSSIVWSADLERCRELMTLASADFELALAQAIENRLGPVKLRSERQSFPLSSTRAENYYKNSLVLIGDAAHSIHPLAGQGANLGFKDIACLSKLLHQGDSTSLGSSSILARYQRLRQNDNQQTDTLMTFLHHAYGNQNPLWTPLRGFGMSLINQTGFLRQLLARQAMGL